ncbi:PspC domain-containing protein [Streptomyces sp. NA04227]|uniref:PspC domain-containing protein n=1 Tax=Streptomyces sp. NA04227 TaxID=2742136 RepID=UPI001591C736|nr:PspC domain-containing protein [Streptomyces sp. NA04227]QKW08686.1 PspC domain-containing protein [Streptomyces sp. NA04227]
MTDQQYAEPDPAPGRGGGSGAAGPGPQERPGAEHPPPEQPRLRRDRGQKILGGVCGGLGRHYDLDPVIFRIVLAVLAVTGGLGLLFYGFAWLFVPLDGEDENEARRLLSGRVDGPALTAVLCKLVGTGLFLSMMSNATVVTFATALSLMLAATAYWSRQRVEADGGETRETAGTGKDAPAATVYGGAPPEAQAPPAPDRVESWWREPIVKDGTHVGGTGYLWGPPELEDPASVPGVLRSAFRPRPQGPKPPAPEPKSKGPRWIGGWIVLLALVAGGVGTGATWEHVNLGASLQTGLASALAVLGLGIALSSWYGRTGSGSMLLAVLTAGLLGASAALPSNITTDWMDRTWHPASAAQVRSSYELGSGDAVLNLTDVRVAPGRTLPVNAEVGAGRLRVVVPERTTVRLHAEVGVGDVQLPGDDQQDVDIAPDKTKDAVLPPAGRGKPLGTLELHLEVGLGQVEVTRVAP